jgi:hypothetical protein
LDGNNVLSSAIRAGHEKASKIFVDCGAEPQLQNFLQATRSLDISSIEDPGSIGLGWCVLVQQTVHLGKFSQETVAEATVDVRPNCVLPTSLP